MTGASAENEWDAQTRDLYGQLLEAWDKRNARNYALLFAGDGTLIGFDGSQVNGQLEIGAHVSEVFSHHQTPRYVGLVREVRSIATDVSLLRANAGLIPPGKEDIDPALNAVQSLVAVKKAGAWKIALFQNTPAKFDMQPEQSKALTEELRARLRATAAREDKK
ncbi:MAG TPA: SgcJ/EcaC family oxidoreductase [Gemmatimonadaceae bacterium]|nr:SgcJ/EcaC family oxidoreductase [Gemmatimonadaceae bacterium]